ncbi:MAG: sigma-70 family RNA polymerase sigma factor [Acidobacteria bacterium]|nr:sigma-70 family RNA polymerase sigma factor [Acidobacteriota bacterium]
MDTYARDLEDELLAIRCQLGEREAFDALIDRWHEPLWRYARRLAGTDDAASEVVQDVWLRVLRGIARLREPARLRSWLFGITRRVLMDRLRLRYANLDVVPVDDVELATAEAADDIEAELESMQEALMRLPLVEREVLTLFYLRELTLVEVAEILEVPAGTVKSRLHRARILLRRELDGSASKGDR